MQELLNVKAAGIYSDHSSLKGFRIYDTQTEASAQSSLHFISETGTEVKIHEPHDEAKLIR
jgi:hypothetical protein